MEAERTLGRPGGMLQGEQPLDLVLNDELPSLQVGFLGASSVSGSALSPLQMQRGFLSKGNNKVQRPEVMSLVPGTLLSKVERHK